MKNMHDYYESSDDDDPSRPAVTAVRLTCSCSGAGSCVWCKKMSGCTCEGQGTCRKCELEEEDGKQEDSDDDIVELCY